jgi:hypothetical protein
MEFTAKYDDTRLEIRVLELEDTVAMMASIIGTMTEMLGKISQITDHCAETILGVTGAIPGTIQRAFPSRPVGYRSGAEETPPSSASRCSCGPC